MFVKVKVVQLAPLKLSISVDAIPYIFNLITKPGQKQRIPFLSYLPDHNSTMCLQSSIVTCVYSTQIPYTIH